MIYIKKGNSKGEERMHDQNSIDKNETPAQKYERALDLFTEPFLNLMPICVGVHIIKIALMS